MKCQSEDECTQPMWCRSSDRCLKGESAEETRELPEGEARSLGRFGSAPWIVCAALRVNGRIICGPRHFDPVMRMQIANDTEAPLWRHAEQGFVDQWGNFLTRKEALEIALRNGQRRRRCGGDDDQLYSENLY